MFLRTHTKTYKRLQINVSTSACVRARANASYSVDIPRYHHSESSTSKWKFIAYPIQLPYLTLITPVAIMVRVLWDLMPWCLVEACTVGWFSCHIGGGRWR